MRTKIIIWLLFLLAFPFFSSAQSHNSQRGIWDHFKAQKIAFLSSTLKLTPEESQKFWPIYNELEKKRIDIQIEKKKIMQKFRKESVTLSDAEVSKMITSLDDYLLNEAKLVKDYNKRFLSFLPSKKVLALFQAENKFRANMIRQFRPKPEGQGQGPMNEHGPDGCGSGPLPNLSH